MVTKTYLKPTYLPTYLPSYVTVVTVVTVMTIVTHPVKLGLQCIGTV